MCDCKRLLSMTIDDIAFLIEKRANAYACNATEQGDLAASILRSVSEALMVSLQDLKESTICVP